MEKQVTRSVWIDGIDKRKAIRDQFGKSVDQIVGNIKTKELTKIDSAWESVKKEGGIFKDFVNKYSLTKVTDMEDVKKLLNTTKSVVEAGRQGLGIYNDFKNKQYEAMLGKMGLISPGNGTSDIISGAKWGMEKYHAIKNTDWKDWQSVMGLASNITGVDIPDFLGITAVQAQIEAILDLAQKNGVYDAIDIIRDKFGRDVPLTSSMYKGMGESAKLGQFETIESMMNIMGGPAVLKVNPGIIAELLTNYRFPHEYKNEDIPKLRERVLKVLRKIDPSWDKEVINEVTYYKLEPWAHASEDAKRLFKDHDIYPSLYLTAPSHPAMTLKQALNTQYPYLRLQ